MFGDLNDCYGRALQQELAEANRLEQELIEASNREAELILDRNETAEFVRNMIHPNIEALRRRDTFLNDRDDIVIRFSGEEIVAECDSNCAHFESALK